MNTDEVLAVILGGGKGTRLYPLTKYRAKPAVPFAGKYRIIDVALSNCLNSGINKIYILTQFNTHSLHRHIYGTYRLGRFMAGFVDILAAQQTMDNVDWYQGTADAVRKNLNYILDVKPRYTLILSGDHLYRMNYGEFLQTHIQTGADITIAVKPVKADEASGFGILQVDASGWITRFVEKPPREVLPGLISPGLPSETPYLASMGIYIFSTPILLQLLAEISQDDFGRHIIPAAIETLHVASFQFNGYWKDIGTISSFFETNLELASLNPPFRLVEKGSSIYTRARSLPGSRLRDCSLTDTMLADGCLIDEATIHKAVIGVRTIIRRGVQIEESVVMGADYYEDESENASIPLGIGEGSVIRRAILDKNVRIGKGVQIVNRQNLKEYDDELFAIRDGIVVIPKNTIIPDGTFI
jgi:glucose-1-phosphate adenylyltransferase